MASAFKKGDAVKQIVPVVSGTVQTLAIVDDEVQFLVEYVDAEGAVHTRYFKEDEIELV